MKNFSKLTKIAAALLSFVITLASGSQSFAEDGMKEQQAACAKVRSLQGPIGLPPIVPQVSYGNIVASIFVKNRPSDVISPSSPLSPTSLLAPPEMVSSPTSVPSAAVLSPTSVPSAPRVRPADYMVSRQAGSSETYAIRYNGDEFYLIEHGVDGCYWIMNSVTKEYMYKIKRMPSGNYYIMTAVKGGTAVCFMNKDPKDGWLLQPTGGFACKVLRTAPKKFDITDAVDSKIIASIKPHNCTSDILDIILLMTAAILK